ncbi:hypothetical protein E4T39_02246 [Aureobasidium subglaciale]|nr:hypothetical protein E4T39_02246 [Aureobasidium subglaciale]
MFTSTAAWSNLLVSTLALALLALAVPCSSCSSTPSNSSKAIILHYINSQLCIQDRLDDLLFRMTLEGKASQMIIKQIPARDHGTIDNTTLVLDQGRNMTTAPLISENLLSHFHVNNALPAKQMAERSRSSAIFITAIMIARTALIVVDVQDGIANLNDGVPDAEQVNHAISSILHLVRQHNDNAAQTGTTKPIKILFIQHDDKDPSDPLWRGKPTWELVFPPRKGSISEMLVSKNVALGGISI